MNLEYGYELPPELKDEIRGFRNKKLYRPILLILIDHILVWVPISFVYFYNLKILFWVYPILLIISIRSLRGLECLVHDASHYNIFGKKKISDFLANLLIALPVFSTVENYRESHFKHHAYLGTDKDPDKIRHEELNLIKLDRENGLKFIGQIIRRIPLYIPGWWKAIGTTWKISLISLIWHIVFIILPLSITINFKKAFIFWIIAFVIPFFFVLPVLRLIGESAEHDYSAKYNIAVGTFSNTGIIHRLLIHPHSDGYHTLHHLFPYIPHNHLPKIDSILRKNDQSKWLTFLRERKKIFQNV